jgi:hypothetical protein
LSHHRNNRKYNSRNDNRPQKQTRAPLKDYGICPYCNKMITDIHTAIADKLTEEPVHFECIIERIVEQEEVSKDEKVTYLGGGSFGIVQHRNTKSRVPFFIRKRIQYEGKDKPIKWRKEVSRRISKI